MEAVTISTVIEFVMMTEKTLLMGSKTQNLRPTFLVAAKVPPVIRKESLLAAQKEYLQRVMDLLSLKEHHARTLLIYYRWDVDRVFNVFADRGKAWLYSAAGLSVRSSEDLNSSQSSDEVTCQICFEDVHANESTIMDCGHCFCNNCWTEHFIVKINEGQSRRITCMAHECYAICDEENVRNLVSGRDPHVAEKFDRFLLESYIEDNKKVKWCPSVPHCGNAIRVECDEYCEVQCACGVQFCFSCSSEAHSPCSCLMWKLWTKKCQDESETVNWIKVNTKYCPKCYKPVEKNGGCNLVRCVCGQPFCWLCGGATGVSHTWNSIEGHTCGRYKEDELENAERAKKQLWRYSHYYNQFKAHTDSLKLEATLQDRLQQKIVILEAKNLESRDFSWVTDGFNRLFRSRRILSYSYPFAYYMFGDDLFKNAMTQKEREIKQNLFEDQQQQLQANIEKLSMVLEQPFADWEERDVLNTRLQIIALSTVTDNLCKKLYDCIESDLLAPLEEATHSIAPYRSMGVEKASEFP
ncbi:probable E3 ubiquitin-protein ligase ARI1 isoform X2 [Coffea eugenioides]|uniref:RBR-type E3 ubiquitin transferase n=1 Tax=Coffea arabica TaxID=13443 RepID=A0A6P6UWY2_COFAR|nr:probable E3 ubiquitin-protein ligase ARI1 isoform X2 [Coffea arabica]XP_027094173.1 probable E3 ubiquitin-protein ligase ARI1 isoform X2 [Coffea arabica]XP_027147977.1 probable E3 ubiquitin-protein ligase ARI1 isoform X2 [Coffea eugenioides]